MAVAPVLPWRKASTELLRDRLFWPAWCGVAVLAISALVMAGLGNADPPPSDSRNHVRRSEASPVTSGAACDVPETSAYPVLPDGNCGLHVPLPL